jgi:hypothetical protein
MSAASDTQQHVEPAIITGGGHLFTEEGVSQVNMPRNTGGGRSMASLRRRSSAPAALLEAADELEG